MNKVKVRFAPSPTGMLHIGGARTALFNYLFAKANGGEFLLRVEDTDKKRSTASAKDEILQSLEWLGLKNDGDIFYQSQREERHKEVAYQLLEIGKAYKCYATKEELAQLREDAEKEKKRFQYDRRWRDKGGEDAPVGQEFVIRLKAPLDGEVVIEDKVQGEVRVRNQDQDDFVILRADGSPTYMLAVVVDDYDMGITHIIRGDDHLTNSFKQKLLYDALEWDCPDFAHIPLIYGEDGKKMSKRHGATAVSDYKGLGYLPEALRNYLLRLGFSHGDDEIISDEQAIKWFDLASVGKSPARFDFKKLDSLNAYYLKSKDNAELLSYILENSAHSFAKEGQDRLLGLMGELKERAKLLPDLLESSIFLRDDFVAKDNLTEKAKKALDKVQEHRENIIGFYENLEDFTHSNIYEKTQDFAEKENIKVKDIAAFLRAAFTGSHISPSIFEIMEVYGKEATLEKLRCI